MIYQREIRVREDKVFKYSWGRIEDMYLIVNIIKLNDWCSNYENSKHFDNLILVYNYAHLILMIIGLFTCVQILFYTIINGENNQQDPLINFIQKKIDKPI